MNAIILAAGTASRFVPLSEETPKGLLEVRGEILIERQIRQLQEAGVTDITVVLGYKSEQFSYLRQKFGVQLVYNDEYNVYNNTSSLVRVVDRLDSTFICCSDHYFTDNVFLDRAEDSYYAALYAEGKTDEYCLMLDGNDWIKDIRIGGKDAWYMAGHVYFNHQFSSRFREIFAEEYKKEETKQEYWEDVYLRHIESLPMKARKYGNGIINEFDSIDELRCFDESYREDTRSGLLKSICKKLSCEEAELNTFKRIKQTGECLMFTFMKGNEAFLYDGQDSSVKHYDL
jgi:CTP:phosphocholine cytidylyltransferase-like protein